MYVIISILNNSYVYVFPVELIAMIANFALVPGEIWHHLTGGI